MIFLAFYARKIIQMGKSCLIEVMDFLGLRTVHLLSKPFSTYSTLQMHLGHRLPRHRRGSRFFFTLISKVLYAKFKYKLLVND